MVSSKRTYENGLYLALIRLPTSARVASGGRVRYCEPRHIVEVLDSTGGTVRYQEGNHVFAASGTRRKALSVAAIGLSTLLLVSCGGDDEEDSTPTVAPATQAVEETEEVTVEPTVEETEEVIATPAMAASPASASPVASGMASPVAPSTPMD